MTLSEKQTQSSFYSAREYLIPRRSISPISCIPTARSHQRKPCIQLLFMSDSPMTELL